MWHQVGHFCRWTACKSCSGWGKCSLCSLLTMLLARNVLSCFVRHIMAMFFEVEQCMWVKRTSFVFYIDRTSCDDSFCMKLCESHIGDLYTDTSELISISCIVNLSFFLFRGCLSVKINSSRGYFVCIFLTILFTSEFEVFENQGYYWSLYSPSAINIKDLWRFLSKTNDMCVECRFQAQSVQNRESSLLTIPCQMRKGIP